MGFQSGEGSVRVSTSFHFPPPFSTLAESSLASRGLISIWAVCLGVLAFKKAILDRGPADQRNGPGRTGRWAR